jgi:hypothetical protein
MSEITPTRKAPYFHEWTLFETGLWRCPWCDGFFASHDMPDRNAVANSYEALRSGEPQHNEGSK